MREARRGGWGAADQWFNDGGAPTIELGLGVGGRTSVPIYRGGQGGSWISNERRHDGVVRWRGHRLSCEWTMGVGGAGGAAWEQSGGWHGGGRSGGEWRDTGTEQHEEGEGVP
jgi:hypothetical protein